MRKPREGLNDTETQDSTCWPGETTPAVLSMDCTEGIDGFSHVCVCMHACMCACVCACTRVMQ